MWQRTCSETFGKLQGARSRKLADTNDHYNLPRHERHEPSHQGGGGEDSGQFLSMLFTCRWGGMRLTPSPNNQSDKMLPTNGRLPAEKPRGHWGPG